MVVVSVALEAWQTEGRQLPRTRGPCKHTCSTNTLAHVVTGSAPRQLKVAGRQAGRQAGLIN